MSVHTLSCIYILLLLSCNVFFGSVIHKLHWHLIENFLSSSDMHCNWGFASFWQVTADTGIA
jgi:hypothetical protein